MQKSIQIGCVRTITKHSLLIDCDEHQGFSYIYGRGQGVNIALPTPSIIMGNVPQTRIFWQIEGM